MVASQRRAPAVAVRLCARAAAWVAIVCAATAGAAQPSVEETDLKVAYVYNFIVLSTWPADTSPVMRFCVAGAQPMPEAFGILGGKPVRSRSLSVTRVTSPGQAVDCQVLYLPPSESRRLAEWLGGVSNRPVLTISNEADDGAIVNLRIARGQVLFDLDVRAAAAAGIQLSSQLIKLAATRK